MYLKMRMPNFLVRALYQGRERKRDELGPQTQRVGSQEGVW